MAKPSSKPVRCIDCGRANIYQYGYDPVIAECDNGDKNVADTPLLCQRFAALSKIRCIENRPKLYWFQK